MARQALTVTHDAARFNRAVQTFLRRQAPEAVDKAARRITLGVAGRTVRAITVGPPTRVDTGRYRAGWAQGTYMATGKRIAAPASSASEPGDGTGNKSGRGLSVVYTVENSVEYGPWVEFGTESMAAGLHLQGALAGEGRAVAEVVGGELARAWER